jgi:hypothetical protein
MGKLLNFWSSLNGINESHHEQRQNDRFGSGTKGVALEIPFDFLNFLFVLVFFGFFFLGDFFFRFRTILFNLIRYIGVIWVEFDRCKLVIRSVRLMAS